MSKPVIDVAKVLIRRRQFSKAIVALENVREIYRDSFDYYVTLGIACLYVGDTGNSNRYFQQARRIKIKDSNLLLGQAALYLRRGDTDIAIQYYLDVLEIDPENKRARDALNFIREKGDYETIVRWVDSGRIERFYPPLGHDIGEVGRVVLSAIAGIAVACLILYCVNKNYDGTSGRRSDLTELALTVEDKENLHEKDLSGGVYRYILTDAQIEECYNQAKILFQDYRDNSARVQINKLLNSNASAAVKAKAQLLLSYFEDPTFDTFVNHGEENFTYMDVASDPVLYSGCWVSWSGRISNARELDDSYRCDLLVGYENLERVDGIVSVYFSPVPVPEIEGDRAVKILAKIGIENGKIALQARSVYQPLRKNEKK